jgi:tRNA(Ile)-lysidine synthase
MPPSIVARIRSEVRRRLGGHRSVILAVSGGVDSMALLDAAAAVRDGIAVATFDHATGAAASEAASLVSSRCRELGVECGRGVASVVASSEAELRAARWSFLDAAATRLAARVATAHTADDQIETVLMRTMRCSGARGLAGLAAEGRVLRPLLAFRRSDIVAYAQARDLEWVEDPSNVSMRFFRNRIRHEVLPALRAVRGSIDEDLLSLGSRAAALRRDVDRFIDEALSVRVLRSSVGMDVGAFALIVY